MKEQDKVQRQVLPIPDRQHVGLTTYDAKDPATKFPPIRDIRPLKGAPNVLINLIDDAAGAADRAQPPYRRHGADQSDSRLYRFCVDMKGIRLP